MRLSGSLAFLLGIYLELMARSLETSRLRALAITIPPEAMLTAISFGNNYWISLYTQPALSFIASLSLSCSHFWARVACHVSSVARACLVNRTPVRAPSFYHSYSDSIHPSRLGPSPAHNMSFTPHPPGHALTASKEKPYQALPHLVRHRHEQQHAVKR